MNNDLLDALFDHLDTIDTSTEFGQTHSACIGKIVSILFEKFPTQLISYFQFRDTFIPSLLTHTKEPNLMEIIYKFVDSDLAHQWLLECDLVARLISLLHFEESLAVCDFFDSLVGGGSSHWVDGAMNRHKRARPMCWWAFFRCAKLIPIRFWSMMF